MPGVSYNPADMAEGGSLFQDGVFDVTGAKFSTTDYNGKLTLRPGEQLPVALFLTLVNEDGQSQEQIIAASNLKNHRPSEDGSELVPVDEARPNLVKNTNFALLMTSLINAGFPVDKLDSDIRKVWLGMRFHGIWVDPPRRGTQNNPAPAAEGQTARVNKLLNVSEILKYPWEAGSAAPVAQAVRPAPNGVSAPASSPAPAAVQAQSGGLPDDLAGELFVFVSGKLEAANGRYLKAKLMGDVFKSYSSKDDAAKKAAFTNAINSGWIEAQGIAELVGNEFQVRQAVPA